MTRPHGDRRAGREARRAGHHHLRRGRRPAAGPSAAWSGSPPHVAAAGRLWDEADVVLAIGSRPRRRADAELRPAAAPTLIAVSLEQPVQLPRGRAADRRRGRRGARAHRRAWASTAAPTRSRTGSPTGARQPTGTSTRPPCASSTRSASPSPPTATSSSTCASRVTGWRASTPPPRRAACRCRWAGGRSATRFPAALGAALAGTGPTVSISGDGGFLFACGELATMAQERIPLTVVIVDDGGYGMLRYDQGTWRATSATGSTCTRPDFAALAAAFGITRGDRRRPRRRVRRGARPPTRRPDARRVLVARTPTPLVPPPNTSPNWYRRRT